MGGSLFLLYSQDSWKWSLKMENLLLFSSASAQHRSRNHTKHQPIQNVLPLGAVWDCHKWGLTNAVTGKFLQPGSQWTVCFTSTGNQGNYWLAPTHVMTCGFYFLREHPFLLWKNEVIWSPCDPVSAIYTDERVKMPCFVWDCLFPCPINLVPKLLWIVSFLPVRRFWSKAIKTK